MKVQAVLDWLDAIAPFHTAEDFDNVGLLLGSPDTECDRVLFGLDVTEALLDEADRLKTGLIVTHHPFIFNAIKRLDYKTPQTRIFRRILAGNYQIIAAHTNWDKAVGGVGDTLAKSIGLKDISQLDEYLRIGTLPAPLSPEQFEALVAERLAVKPRLLGAVAAGCPAKILRVAVAGGSYGDGAAIAARNGADAFVVGEIHHKQILDALAQGEWICDAGHYATEFPGARALYQRYVAEGAAAGLTAEAHLFTAAPY